MAEVDTLQGNQAEHEDAKVILGLDSTDVGNWKYLDAITDSIRAKTTNIFSEDDIRDVPFEYSHIIHSDGGGALKFSDIAEFHEIQDALGGILSKEGAIKKSTRDKLWRLLSDEGRKFQDKKKAEALGAKTPSVDDAASEDTGAGKAAEAKPAQERDSSKKEMNEDAPKKAEWQKRLGKIFKFKSTDEKMAETAAIANAIKAQVEKEVQEQKQKDDRFTEYQKNLKVIADRKYSQRTWLGKTRDAVFKTAPLAILKYGVAKPVTSPLQTIRDVSSFANKWLVSPARKALDYVIVKPVSTVVDYGVKKPVKGVWSFLQTNLDPRSEDFIMYPFAKKK